ncbi:hypothetical protein HDU93_002576 [Gonapodya sp. JEL0774]|nr:hypothetical protein HDU93_002576 [Gonapodya sp. JEL0774]
MAANYWDSTQRNNWTLDRQSLLASRTEDLLYVSEKELVWLNLYYSNLIVQLGRKLGVRQQVIATAMLYFKRYYTRNPFRRVDPILTATTCTFLAAKVEECPHHIRSVVDGMREVMADLGGFPFESHHVAAFEFYLLEDLDFPLLQTCWYAINDAARTDLPLLHPPHVVALAVLFLVTIGDAVTAASVGGEAGAYMRDKEAGFGEETVDRAKVAKFFGDVNVDMSELLSIVHTLLRHYRDVEEYREVGEARIAGIIQKLHGGAQGQGPQGQGHQG